MIAKKKRHKRRKRVVFFFAEVVLLAIMLVIGYGMMKYGKIQMNPFQKDEIQVNTGVKQDGYTTIALFGGDSREGELEAGTHADTMIVVSINNETKEVKMVSVYRDTLMSQKDGQIKKANSAYFMGGPSEAINMLNRNLDLDIEYYVTVDFKALVDVIDLVGGIELAVTEAEAAAMNEYIPETARVAKKEPIYVSEGTQLLDGVQAVTYARIRKNVGGDYARTDRQRLVIQKLVEKTKKTNLSTINSIIDEVFPQVSTNLTLSDALKMAANVMQYKLGESKGFPFERTDGNIADIGSVVIPLGLKENVEELHAFLYSNDEYVVTQTVQEIAAQIEMLSGYTREDYQASSDAGQTDE